MSRDSHARLSRGRTNEFGALRRSSTLEIHSTRIAGARPRIPSASKGMLSKVEVRVPDSGPLRPSRPIDSRPLRPRPGARDTDALHAIREGSHYRSAGAPDQHGIADPDRRAERDRGSDRNRMDRVQQRRDPDHREAGDLGSRRPLAGAETTSVVQERHPESKYLYRTAYTLLTAKNPLKVTHHGAEEHGDSGQRGTDEPSEDDRVALRLVGRHGPVVRQLPPELRGPFRGRSPRPVDRLRPARPRTPRRPDRQGFRVRGPGGTPRRGEGGCRPDRHRGRD